MRALPWLEPLLKQFSERRLQGRFPHALLLTGLPGVGKSWLAEQMVRLLVCEQPSEAGACGHCRGCELEAAGTHPDSRTIVPPEGKQQIRVDQIRAVSDFCSSRVNTQVSASG
ncbi:hypothetical protein CAI21_09175 [Alkalilimnicola ehrlichii]|uniref:DNA polymerase III subunit delta n=1 Tax=Alkalilimnicola ehrlichii TaxID=351052 RepID=A0A3E0WLF8_9GAMM|nr:hypothetical protein [Alkalilimnicola ehrlichii]RFA29973.1 hypothetical protein CAI21_09175 [Alkalilimnicola ehrlichii]RFA33792.1 hypothetical protein CAL65_16835 [Alkalilimnicola ehrlichii]